MRPLGSLVTVAFLLLSLAACQVDVEGAACEVPGAADQCPSGQACGNDLRCSGRAASCAARCKPDADVRCAAGHAAVEVCRGTDPVCGAWTAQPACAPYTCRDDLGETPACACPAADGAVVWADPAGGTGPHAPTGAGAPVACRFPTLAAALDGRGSATTVQLSAGTFGAELTFPVAVPAGVTLRGASAAETSLVGPSAAAPLVVLGGGARLEGLSLAAADRTVVPNSAAVPLACPAGSPVSLADVQVDAGGFADGITVGGECQASLSRVGVTGAANRALLVSGTADVAESAGTWENSGIGVQVTGGTFSSGADGVGSSLVTGNAGAGVHLFGAAVTASLARLQIQGNGSAGLVVQGLAGSSAVQVVDGLIRGNGASPLAYGAGGTRSVGGVLVRQAAAVGFSFLGNQVYANGGDQIAFWSGVPWVLGPGQACGPGSNFIGCVPAAPLLGVASTGGAITADGNLWSQDPPDNLVDANTTVNTVCASGVSGAMVAPTCP